MVLLASGSALARNLLTLLADLRRSFVWITTTTDPTLPRVSTSRRSATEHGSQAICMAVYNVAGNDAEQIEKVLESI